MQSRHADDDVFYLFLQKQKIQHLLQDGRFCAYGLCPVRDSEGLATASVVKGSGWVARKQKPRRRAEHYKRP